MIRNPDLHDLFGRWISTRAADSVEDPPRDLALHAAGCDRCLRVAAAMDMLGGIDVGAAGVPPLISVPLSNERGALGPLARYAVISVTLVLGAATATVGSSWLAGSRSTNSAADPSTTGEGVLAGVPSGTASPRLTPSPTATASQRSPTPEPSVASPEESPAPPAGLPPPPAPPPPAPATVAPATAAPTIPARPTPTATPRPSPTTAPSPSPTPSPTPTPTWSPTPTPTPTPPTGP